MNPLATIYEIGTAGILLSGVLSIVISLNSSKWCVFGKATLVYLGLFLIAFSFVRVAVGAGFDRQTAGEIVGAMGAALSVTLGLMIGLHATLHVMIWKRCKEHF